MTVVDEAQALGLAGPERAEAFRDGAARGQRRPVEIAPSAEALVRRAPVATRAEEEGVGEWLRG